MAQRGSSRNLDLFLIVFTLNQLLVEDAVSRG